MRETSLDSFQGQGDVVKHDNAPLERLRKHADDKAKFYNINRKGQIQSLVVTIPACEASAQVT